MNKEVVGKFIKEQRAKIGITQQDLAEILCTSRENISKWERGLAIPNTEYLKPLCKTLKVPITDLLAGKIESDKEDASNVIYDIMDTNQRIRKRFFKIFIITILVSIFIFLTYYFLDNYNSIKIYAFDCDTDGYELDNSLLLILKKKGYFVFNNLKIPENKTLENFELYYYDKDNEKVTIYNSNKLQNIIKIEFELSNINNVINNSYIEITTNEETKTIKLDIRNRYANSELFEKIENNKDLDESHNFYFKDFTFPSLSEFTYDNQKELYKYHKGKVNIEYYPHTKEMSLQVNNKSTEEMITFLGDEKNLLLYNKNKASGCYYNYESNQVVSGECDEYIFEIDILVKKYLDFIS